MVLAACASGQGRSNEVNPVGAFDFSTAVDGMPVTGTVTITGQGPQYGGSITTNVIEALPISTVTVEGQTVQIGATGPDGSLTFSMVFTGETFTGSWTYAGMQGTLTGRRRAS
jgi:hypothetical protein